MWRLRSPNRSFLWSFLKSAWSVCGWLECPSLYHIALQYFPIPLDYPSQCESGSNTFQVTNWSHSKKSNRRFLTHPHSYCFAHPSLLLTNYTLARVFFPPTLSFLLIFYCRSLSPTYVSVLYSKVYFIMKLQDLSLVLSISYSIVLKVKRPDSFM